MKITKDNLASEFENYKKFLKDDDMRSKVKDTIEISEFYDEDADIKKAVDEMVEMVNEQIAKNEKKSSQQKKEQEPKDIELIWDLAADTYELWIDHKKVDDSVFTTIEGFAEYIQLNYPELMKRKDVILQLENYGWKKNKTSIPKPKKEVKVNEQDSKKEPKKQVNWEKFPIPKYNVGDWVISKIHTPEGVKESFPILITEVMVMPDGKVSYTFDGGDFDVFEDEIIRKTTAPKAKKEEKKESPKTKKEPKAKKESKKKEKPTSNATPVEALSPEVKLIKRVITLQGKTMKKANSEKTNNPRAILNAIQRAIRTKQIRKTSKYADEIMYAQDALIRMVNGSLNGTLSGADVINFTRYDDLEKVAHSEVVSEAAKIAAQFIKIQEQAGKEKEAGTLLKRIEKSNENGEEIDGMKKALKNYVEGKTTKLKASEQVLRGLHGIVDVNFESGDVVNSTTIEGKNFDTLDFHGRWEGFFGKPSPDFKFMFYGKPGNGKSTFALQFAGYLSKELGKSVLYVANEEGFGYTLQEKVKRLNVANSNLYLCDSVPEDLSQFDVVFLDSVNNLGLEPEDLKAMPAGKAYVYVFQTTKDGNYMGKQEFAHDVDTVVRVENMNAYKDKNRYGGEIQEFKVG
ncbi:MAG: AAA family ATPase [Paludibacteraceae bacterium]|nr:AAA family ATPase [Paludibacteraceae bacterium]